MMIGDCKTRMENAFNDLLAAVVRLRTLPPKDNFSSSRKRLPLSPRTEGGGGRNSLPKKKKKISTFKRRVPKQLVDENYCEIGGRAC